MNLSRQYQQMHAGAVKRPQLQPVKAPLWDLLYRGQTVAQSCPKSLLYAKIANLVGRGTHQKRLFEVKEHI